MWCFKGNYVVFLFMIFVQFHLDNCKMMGGGGGRSRPSRPRPVRRPYTKPPSSRTYTIAPTRAPTYMPFPSPVPTNRPQRKPASRPRPSRRPYTKAPTARSYTLAPTRAPTHMPFPSPIPTYKPQPKPASRPRPSPTHRPYTNAPTARPYTQAPTRAPTYRPFPSQAPTFRPQPQPGKNPTYRPATQPGKYPTQPGRYPTQPTRYPQGPPPAVPGYQPGGYRPNYGQPNQQNYQRPLQIPQPGGKTKVKVYNINNYHSPSYFAPPSYPMYHYSSRDTGSGVLGFFLGYSLARLTSPTYYRCHSCYSGYGPRYDHYTVHHYYHNSGNVPKEQTVTTNNIITCGDSSQICPANTVALCTASGQIMCVVAVANTVQCKDNPNLKCVQSSIPCENTEAPECKGVPKGQAATVSIPCISNTVIEGNVTTVNNTIISTDPPKNNTELNTDAADIGNNTFPSLGSNDTFPSLGSNSTQSRVKREAAQPYCVTVLAEPSVRKPTEGETVFNEVTNVFEQFFSKAFGMDNAQKNK